jgi:hypothetical protein
MDDRRHLEQYKFYEIWTYSHQFLFKRFFFSFLGKFNKSVTSSGIHQEYKLKWNFCNESILELLYDQKLASSNASMRRFKVRQIIFPKVNDLRLLGY